MDWQHCAPPTTLHWLTVVAVGVAVAVIVVVGSFHAKAAVARAVATSRRVNENIAGCSG